MSLTLTGNLAMCPGIVLAHTFAIFAILFLTRRLTIGTFDSALNLARIPEPVPNEYQRAHSALISSIDTDFRNRATCAFGNLFDFRVPAIKGHSAVVSLAFELRSTLCTSFKKVEYKLGCNPAADFFFMLHRSNF